MIFIKDELDSNEERIKQAAGMLNLAKNIVFSGIGDKYYSCLISQFLADAYYKNVRVIHSRLLVNYTPEWLNKDAVIVFVTASGTTLDVLEAAKEAKKKGAKVVILTGKAKKIEHADLQIVIAGGLQSLIAHINSIIIFSLLAQGKELTQLFTIQNIDLPWDIKNLEKNTEVDKWAANQAKLLKEKGILRYYLLGDGPRYAAAHIAARMNKYESHTFRSEGFEHDVPYDPKGAVILLKPRESQISERALGSYNVLRSGFKHYTIEVDPFTYIEPKGIGKKMDILLTPLYIILLEKLMNELSKED